MFSFVDAGFLSPLFDLLAQTDYHAPLYFVAIYFVATGGMFALHQMRAQITMAPMLAFAGLLTFLVWQLVQIGWWVDWRDFKINAALLATIPALIAGSTMTYAMDGIRASRAYLVVMIGGALLGMGYSYFIETLGRVTAMPSLFFIPIASQAALAGSLILAGIASAIGSEIAQKIGRIWTLPMGFALGVAAFLPSFSFMTYGMQQGVINLKMEWPEFVLVSAPVLITLFAYAIMAIQSNSLMPKRSVMGIFAFWTHSGGLQKESIIDAREQIAELRQLNQALQQEESLRHQQMQRSPLALIELDKSARIERFNPAAQMLLGEHLVSGFLAEGHSIYECLPELKSVLSDPILQQNRYLKYQLNSAGSQQEKIIELTIQPTIAGKSISGYGIQAEDVSAREQEERRKLLSERVRGIHKTSQVIHHDFSNLMLAIQGHLNHVKSKLSPASGGDVDQALDAIYKASQRGKDMLGQLGTGQVFHKPALQTTLLSDLIAEAVKIIGPQAKSQKVHIDAAPTAMVYVDVDSTQILRVFINLLSNSIRAMPGGGTITIVTHAQQQGVDVVFRDSGVGMDADQLQKVFDPGFSTKGQGQGGLGLAISYLITEAHGGKLVLESAVGHGTSAKIWLPLAQPAAQTEKSDQNLLPAIDIHSTEGVLLMLPEGDVRRRLVGQFESIGCDVAELEDNQELEALLQDNPDHWTVLVRSKNDTLSPQLWHQCRFLCDIVIDPTSKHMTRIRPSSKSQLSTADLQRILDAA